MAIRHAFGAVRNRVRGTPLGAVRDGRGALALLSPGARSDTRASSTSAVIVEHVRDGDAGRGCASCGEPVEGAEVAGGGEAGDV
jgi:hypothetical protein